MRATLVCLLAVTALAAAEPKKPLPPWRTPTLTAWSGDSATGAGGWSGATGTCSFTRVTDDFRRPPAAARWHVDVPGQFINGGWNWCGWFPSTAGTDLTAFKTMRFAVRVVGTAKPQSLRFLVTTSSNQPSGKLELQDYCPAALDGEWHDVALPVKDLSAGVAFDPKKAWEIQFETWSATPLKFDLYVDEIGFDR